MMADFSDSERDGQRLVSTFGTVFLLFVYILSAGLDVIDLVLVGENSKSTARLACSIQSFALVPVPLAPRTMSDPCLGEVHEPDISILFLSIKFSMAFAAFPVLWVFWHRAGFLRLRDIYWRRFGAPGGYLRELGSFIKNSSGIFAFLACCLLFAAIEAANPAIRFALALKFVLEDGLAIAMPVMTMDLVAKASLFVSYAWTHRDSMPRHDG
jgi:hypothetical protein